MLKVLNRLWREDEGFIVSTELILIGSILVLGLVAGLASLAGLVSSELGDLGAAISVINQSYSYAGVSGLHGLSGGTVWLDTTNDTGHDGSPGVTVCSRGTVIGGESAS